MRKNKSMTLNQFRAWCNQRACDGCWSENVALFCIELLRNMEKIAWWRRRKVWGEISVGVMASVVGPINRKIEEARKEKIEEEMRYGF